MTVEAEKHKTIARPAGISGYTPQSYCSVCGKTTANSPFRACVGENCDNSAHISCLGTNTEFSCSTVGSLREALSITAPVSYVDRNSASLNSSESSTESNSSAEDDTADLLKLQPTELVDIIRGLRVELSRKNKLINFYNKVSSNISGARDAVVGVLEFIDNIAANHSSLEAFDTRTIASSARPEWIDNAWINHVTANQDTQDWWMSENPRSLRSTTTALPPGPRLISPEQQVTSAPSTEASTQSDTNESTQTQPETRGQRVLITPQSVSSAPARDPPGAEPNSAQQRPNPASQNHSAQPLSGNLRQQGTSRPARTSSTGVFVDNNRGQESQNKKVNKNKRLPKSFPSSANQARTAPLQFCNFCRRKGHTEINCLRKIKCDYCHRQGHSIQDCHTRLAEERQQKFFQRLSSEQAQNTTILVQSLSRLIAPASLQPVVPTTLPQSNWNAQPALPAQQQPLQFHPDPTKILNHPNVWSHGSLPQ